MNEPVPLTSTEALLWTIERDPVLRSTIVAVLVLDGMPDLPRLRERLILAGDVFPRMRQRVSRSRRGTPRWTDVPEWTVDHHLTHVRLPVPGTMRQLLDLAGEQAGESFDPARPLWHATVVDGVMGGRSALVMKMHHAVTDGVGGIGLLPVFTDLEPNPTAEPDLSSLVRPSRRPRRANPVGTAASLVGGALADPVGAARAAPRVARSTVKLLAPAPHAMSPVTTHRGLDRRLEVLDVALADLERAGHAVGGTVNDAFLGAVVGGMRRYHLAHGASPERLRVTMPINLRNGDDDAGGNRFSLVRFVVPSAVADPVARMEALGDIARGWRREPSVGITDVLTNVLSHLPDPVSTALFGSMLKGVDFLTTNVPGSRERRWLAGAEVLRFYGYGPTSGAAVSFALLSHVDTCCVGINLDTSAIPDPEVLVRCVREGFDEVVEVGRTRPPQERTAVPSPPAVARHARPPRRLSALDATFLEAETARTPMHVGALALFDGERLRADDGELRMDDIRAEIAAHLPRCPRMLQRAVPVPLGRPVWEDDPDFDIADHVRHVRVPSPGTRAQLDELCCELQMQVLDRSRPLWEMWFVDGLVDGSVALVYKVHHAVVDGVSASETFEVLLGAGAVAAAPSSRARPSDPVTRTAAGLVDGLVTSARWWSGVGRSLVRRPQLAAATAIGIGNLVLPTARAPKLSLDHPVGDRRLLVNVGLDVDELKYIGRHHGATVNDVVLTLVAGGIRELLSSRGESADHVRVLVPVSMRSDDGHDGVGNKVAALIVPLRVDLRDPVVSLVTTAAETRARKAGPDLVALDGLLRWSDTLPPVLLGPASRRLVHEQEFVNLVVTNVRGADHQLSLLGAPISEIVPIVPLGGRLSLGVAVLSYDGRLVIAMHADADGCPDVELVAKGIEATFEELQASVPTPR